MDYVPPTQIGVLSGEQVEIYAEVMPGGVECPIVRTADGKIYSILSMPGSVEVKDRLRIRGRVRLISFCMQGQTLKADQVEVLTHSNSGQPASRR